MDPVLLPLLVNLLSSVIWELVRDPLLGSGLTSNDADRFTQVAEETAHQLGPALKDVGEDSRDEVIAFLDSPETRAIVSQLYRTRWADPHRSVADLRQAFSTVWGTQHPRHVRAIAPYDLFDTLLESSDRILERAIAAGNLGAHESRSAARHNELLTRLTSIERSVALLRDATQTDLDAIQTFEGTLRKHLPQAYANVAPPSVKGEREVPMDSVYVAPLFSVGPRDSAENRQADLGLESVVQQAHRLVVLGDPGAGKSTFARHLCLDLARDRQRLAGGARGLGIFIELREYIRRRDQQELGLVEYITEYIRNRMALHPPPSAISHLLSTGRLSLDPPM